MSQQGDKRNKSEPKEKDSEDLPNQPTTLTAEQVGKLTVEQQRQYFVREMLENLNNPLSHYRSK